jgi:hypothetical protein
VAKAVPAVGSLVPTLVPTPLGIGALYVRDDAQSTVNVNAGASIKSDGLSVQAHNNAEMEGSIASGANSKNKSDFFGVAAAVTFADVKAEAHVNQGATLTVANDLTVSATNVGRYANSVESISGPNGTADVAVAYADHRSSANASLGASVGDAKNVSVLAINEVQKDHAEAVAKVGSSELGRKCCLNDHSSQRVYVAFRCQYRNICIAPAMRQGYDICVKFVVQGRCNS